MTCPTTAASPERRCRADVFKSQLRSPAAFKRRGSMRNRLSTLALAAVLTAGASGIALAQTCPPGYMFDGAYCRPGTPGYSYAPSNPVSGAAAGGAAGAAAGGAAAGPVGAVVGGGLRTPTGAGAGTTKMGTRAPGAAHCSHVSPPSPAPAVGCEPGGKPYSERWH